MKTINNTFNGLRLFFMAGFLLFAAGQTMADCWCGGYYPMCACGTHCTYCEPDCGCPVNCTAGGNHCTVCDPECDICECPACSLCKKGVEGGKCSDGCAPSACPQCPDYCCVVHRSTCSSGCDIVDHTEKKDGKVHCSQHDSCPGCPGGGGPPAWRDGTLSQGRKLSLSGMPVPDVAEHQEGESDYKPEKTYIDALNLDLRYDVTDVFVPAGTEQLALEVRRSLRQEVWSTNSPPLERQFDKPFGPCWSSSLAPAVHLVYSYGNFVGYHMSFEVTDHMGQTYSFRSNQGPSGWSNSTTRAYAMYKFPAATQSALSLEQVEFDYSTATGGVLRLPNGTVLEYEGIDMATKTEVRPPHPLGESDSDHAYARVRKVTDRYGNTLVYEPFVEGGVTNGIIPAGIVSSVDEDLSISITQSNGLVTCIADPRGGEIQYAFTNYTWSFTNHLGDVSACTNALLSEVERENGGSTLFTYESTAERSTYQGENHYYRADAHHWTIKSITDANDNTYSFDYTNAVRYTYRDSATNGMFFSIGDPRVLTKVVRPDGSTVHFEDTGALGTVDGGGTLQSDFGEGVRQNTVVDVNSNVWQYTCSDPVICYPDTGTDSEVKLFEYRNMEIALPDPADTNVLLGCETHLSGRMEGYGTGGLEIVAAGSSTNWSGRQVAFAYDYPAASCVKPLSETNALGGVKHYTYIDQFGWQIESATDELGRKTAYGFDDLGNRTSQTNYAANSSTVVAVTLMEYGDTNQPNFMTKKTVKKLAGVGDPAWVDDMATEYVPHPYGKVWKEIVDPDGLALTTEYDYDPNNNLVKTIDPNGNMVTNGYDQLNRLVEIAFFEGTNTLKSTKRFWYDKRGNKTWEKDENDHYTFFQFDEFNNATNTVRIMAERSDPASGLESYSPTTNDIATSSEYNLDGTLHASVDARGLRTEFEYDELRRLTNSVVDPGGLDYQTGYEYGENCGSLTLPPYKFMPTKVIDPRGFATETTFDALNRPIEIKAEVSNGVYAVTLNQYDAAGNLIAVSNLVASGVWQVTRTAFDDLNRPIAVTNADNTVVETLYTSTGLEWKSIDELGRETEVEFDLAGRPFKTISPELAPGIHAVTETGYDKNSNPVWIEDANNNVTSNVYDHANRLVQTLAPSVWDEEGGSNARPTVTTYFDAIGNVTGILDARGNLTTNFYDAANRLTNSILPSVPVYGGGAVQPAISTVFDKNGNPRFVTDANNVTVEMQYDLLNQLTNTIDGLEHSIGYEYDESGNRTKIVDQNGNETQFVFDGLNRLVSTIYPDTSHEDAGYDLVGNRIQRTDAGGQVTDYEFDLRNRLGATFYPMDEYSMQRKRTYEYDLAGNLETVAEEIGYYWIGGNWWKYEDIPLAEVSYAYDALNRVTNETSVGVTHQYQYDLNSNRTNAVYGVTGRSVEWFFDGMNRIDRIEDTQGYTATVNVSGALQTAIDSAAAGSLILVADGTYDPIVVDKPVTVQSANGASSARIAGGSPASRCATLSNNAVLAGFTLTGGSLSGTTNGAGAFVDEGCLISDCVISNNQTATCSDAATPGGKGGGLYLRGTALRCFIVDNTSWNGAGAYLEDGASMADCTIVSNTASGINAYGGGLYLEDGASAVNCAMFNNAATDGGGIFFEEGGLAQGVTSSSNSVDSIGGAGAFLWAGGTLRNGIIEGNIATNQYARGGAGIMFFDEGGLVEDSTIAGNVSATNNGGIHYRYSGWFDPGTLGTVNNSILWSNGTQNVVWNGTGNQTIDPATTNSAIGADIPVCLYSSQQVRTTSYKYDLNSNPMCRKYPTGVEETRTFDALNRLQTMTTASPDGTGFSLAYQYDANGVARRMAQTSWNLEGRAQDAVYAWGYDDRYRLTNETVVAGGTTSVSSYTWDPADNRMSQSEHVGGALSSTTVYTNNILNQMLGYTEIDLASSATNVVGFAFDLNGARTNKTVLVGGTNAVSTVYFFDEDNRLVEVVAGIGDPGGSITNRFAYDYRTRKVWRATSTETNTCVFDGGLAVQEYDTSAVSTLAATNLAAEYIRTEGLGGGVGGMLYSIRNGGIICSHANHRGDVIARTGGIGSLTWFARYEAYGTRPYEWGSNPDRQMANTKYEESEIGLLDERMRPRELETGIFLCRDPLGYADGPNLYCYVHASPISHYDPLGLEFTSTTEEEDDGSTHTEFTFSASVVFEDERMNEQNDNGSYKYQNERDQYVQNFRDSMMESYNGKDGNHTWSMSEKNLGISIAGSAKDVPENNHLIVVTSKDEQVDSQTPGRAEQGGGMAVLYAPSMGDNKTPAHEVLHFAGIRDNAGDTGNLSYQTVWDPGGEYTELTSKMARQIQANYDTQGAINNNLGQRSDTSKFAQPRNRAALREAAIHYRPKIINGGAVREENYNYSR